MHADKIGSRYRVSYVEVGKNKTVNNSCNISKDVYIREGSETVIKFSVSGTTSCGIVSSVTITIDGTLNATGDRIVILNKAFVSTKLPHLHLTYGSIEVKDTASL